MGMVYTSHHDTDEIEHGSSACTVDSPLAKARGLSPHRRTNHALPLTHKHHSRGIQRLYTMSYMWNSAVAVLTVVVVGMVVSLITGRKKF